MPVAKGTTLDPDRTRAEILRAAGRLLYRHGLDGIGVAGLCTELGISKETLYRHFGSKDGLIAAALSDRSDRATRWLADAVAAAGNDPADQLAAVFDVLSSWHAEPEFRGCAILNAATQHHADPVRSLAARHLDRRLNLLTGIAAAAGASDPDALGRQLLILVAGATTVADHRAGAASDARSAALTLLHAALTRGPSSCRRSPRP